MALIWVIDSCSIIQIKVTPQPIRGAIILRLDKMAADGLLIYPVQVLDELKSYAPPKALKNDVPYTWAKKHEEQACYPERLHTEGKAILKAHNDLIDPNKTTGPDPADPYVIALAQKLRGDGHDARIVTDDTRQINNKVSVAAVAGLLGIPSTVMRLFLRGEGFTYGP